jgi:UDP-N-acetylmuramate--alanine ligase
VNPVDRAQQLIEKSGHVHLMGIGGIGMAGIAFLLKERGFKVTGCDVQENRQTAWLKDNGVDILSGHHASHITDSVSWLIRSTAVSELDSEVKQANAQGIPVSRRGEVLPALMRNRTSIAVSGTHGKTTTTAIIAQVLDCGYCVGGEISRWEGVAKDRALMVVEADESDGTVAGYSPDIAIITNIEYDHMEHHASEAAFIGCFERLIENTKQKVYYCAEDPIAGKLCAANPKCEPYQIPPGGLKLPFPGLHNQWNAAAALAVAKTWKSESEIRRALEKIHPIQRRFETVYEQSGIQIVSDYAHHPTEISALIQTARELNPRRLVGLFQPHRYTRTLALGDAFPPSFNGMDKLWLVPVYAASEQPLEGGTTQDLIQRFPVEWEDRVCYSNTLENAWAEIQSELQEGDLLLIIGAGDIEKVANWAKQL